jgi:hypothetical protein
MPEKYGWSKLKHKDDVTLWAGLEYKAAHIYNMQLTLELQPSFIG